MTSIPRPNHPPATPVHPPPASKRDRAILSTPLDHAGHRHLPDLSPTQDSPLPPAPVSAFIGDEESEEDAARASANPTNPALAARASASAAPSTSTYRQAATRPRATVSRIARERPQLSDEDSPGVGRRAPAPAASRLDDLGVPRASYLLHSERARLAASRSSPVVKPDDLADAAYLDRKSSPAGSHVQLPSTRTAQAATGSRYRSSHAPVSSAAFAKTGEPSRPAYGGLGRSASYGNGDNTVDAVRDDARLATRSSTNSIANGREARSRPSSSAAAAVAEPFNRRMSRTPPSEARATSSVPSRRSLGEPDEDMDMGARAVPTLQEGGLAPSGSRANSRNGHIYREDQGEQWADGGQRRGYRRSSDEREHAGERARPRMSGDQRLAEEREELELARAAHLGRSRSPPPSSTSPDLARPGSAAHDDPNGGADRSPPPSRLRSEARSESHSYAPEGGNPSAASGYRTPAMGGRALRSSLAASNGARSAGRSLRKLARSSNHHVPARRVQRYQDEEEDEDLDDEAKTKEDNDDGSDRQSPGAGHDDDDNNGRLHASGGSSGSGSRGASDERDSVSPRLRQYGYDPVEAASRAELLERASLVRSPSPRQAQGDAADDNDPAPPPPSRKEQHPNARRPASGDNMGRKENVEPAARRKAAGANAMHDILAAKVPAPGAQLAGVRRAVPAADAAAVPARSAFAPSAAQNQAKAGAAPLVPSSVPPPPPEAMAEGDEEIDEEIYRQYSDCRPDLIWGEADRQLEQPLANHANLMDLVKGPPKATAMQGLKYRKVKKAGRGGFSVVWVVRGPLYEPSAVSPQDVEEVPEERQAFFALKQVSLKEVESEQNRQELISEANTLRTLANLEGSEKYLLRYFGHRVSNDKLKILLELGDGDFNGILATQAPLPRELIAHYWREMLEAVQFIHDVNLVHTDLKPANFLIVKNRIKLIDFGIAQNIPKGTVHISRDAIIGTPNYMAPEAIKIAKAKGRRVYKAGKPSDVWSLGCILYQMIWGRPPFDKLPSDRKLEGIMDPHHKIAYPPYRDPRYVEVEDVDSDMLDCVRLALQYRVEDRATIPQLLGHPFLRRRRSSQQEEEEAGEEEEEEGDGEDLEETVKISRAKLRDLVGRLRVLALREELTEENVVERADMLFNNLKQSQS